MILLKNLPHPFLSSSKQLNLALKAPPPKSECTPLVAAETARDSKGCWKLEFLALSSYLLFGSFESSLLHLFLFPFVYPYFLFWPRDGIVWNCTYVMNLFFSFDLIKAGVLLCLSSLLPRVCDGHRLCVQYILSLLIQ